MKIGESGSVTKIGNSADTVTALFYGVPKSGKTTFATEACNSNFAVTILDFENNLFPATRHAKVGNINVIPLHWAGESTYNIGIEFLRLLRNAKLYPFTWDCTAKHAAGATLDPEHEYVRVDLSKTSQRDVMIVDSWSVVCQQIVAGKFNKYYDINAQVKDTSQPMWGTYVNDADGVVHILKSLPINVKVLLAHEYTEATLTHPISVTKAHGQNLAANFDLVARFKDNYFDTTTGGGLVARAKKELDKYTMSMLLSELRIESPAEFTPSEAFVFATGEEMSKMLASKTALNASTNVNVKII